ncbi:DUF1795 domain-containing protein, partial [Myroides sp. LoEW2-1]
MKKIIAIAFLALTTISCNQKVTPPTTLTVENYYTIEMPGNLAPMENLFPNADLQYGNTFKQVYFVATKEAKTEDSDFSAFIDKALARYNKKPNYEIVKENEVRINGLPGKTYELKMSQNETYMYMIQVMIEGQKANYEIISWTTSKNSEVESEKLIN